MSIKYKAAWDYELWVKMSNCSKAIPVRVYLAKFRRHNNSISENYYQKQFQEELSIARKHGNSIHFIIHYILVKIRTIIYRFWI